MDIANKISLRNFIETFRESEKNNQRFCFILGSGASRESGIPTGVTLEKRWLEDIKKKYTQEELDNFIADHGIQNLDPISENYFHIYDLRFSPEYRNGYAYLEKEMENKNPSLGYSLLAQILSGEKHNLVITTNFDSLMEDSLFLYTEKRPLVIGHESLTDFLNLNLKRPVVAKVHRSLYFNPLNSKDETDCLAKGWETALNKAFMMYKPIIIGYAGGDQSLMGYLEKAELDGMYWCYWNKEEPTDKIKELVRRNKGCLVPIEGFDHMMFMLGKDFGISDMSRHLKETTDKRIEKLNDQYREFNEKLRVSEEPNQDTADALDEIDVKKREELERAASTNDYYQMGLIHLRNLDYQDAVDSFTICEDNLGNYSEAKQKDIFLRRGNAFYFLGNYQKALDDYGKAIDLNPEDIAYLNRGISFRAMGENEKAIEDYNIAIKLNSENATVYNSRGLAYSDLGDNQKALDDYGKAIELNPEYTAAYINRGISYRALGENEKAIEDYDKAIELNPSDAIVYNNRGVSYSELGDYQKAIEDYNQAIDLNPEYTLALNNREDCLKKLNKYAKT